MFDFLHQLEATQTLLLTVIAFGFTSTAILASYQKETDMRIYMLMVLTIICIVVGFKAEYVFEELNHNKIYEAFFLNLSVELASAWLIFPITIGLWDLTDSLVVPIFACLLMVGVVIGFLKPEHLSMLESADVTADAIQDLVVNIKFEMISTVVVLIALIMVGAFGMIFNQDKIGDLKLIDQWLIALIVIVTTGIIGYGLSYMSMQLPAYNPFQDNIHTSIVGALITTWIIADWIGSDSHTFAIVTSLILVLTVVLILQIEKPIWFDSNANLSLSTELLGALVAGVLLNRKWLWTTRKLHQ